jgi:hypothetical protein
LADISNPSTLPPAGVGVAPIPSLPVAESATSYWLCQFDVRCQMPGVMPVSNMENAIAFAVNLYLMNQKVPDASVQVTLIATSGGTVSQPTSPAEVAFPTVTPGQPTTFTSGPPPGQTRGVTG